MLILRLLCLAVCIFSCLAQQAYVNLCANEDYGNIVNPSPQPDPAAPDSFIVTIGTNCSTGVGVNQVYEPITLAVYRSWAPLGVDRFWSLLQDRCV